MATSPPNPWKNIDKPDYSDVPLKSNDPKKKKLQDALDKEAKETNQDAGGRQPEPAWPIYKGW